MRTRKNLFGQDMKLNRTDIDGLYIIEPKDFTDKRGSFIKTYTHGFFSPDIDSFTIKESYYTLSKKGVIRGMHFQAPPHEHTKLVYVPHGAILDVVLDIRKDSPSYGKYFSIELSAENKKLLHIPPGLAHGFKSLQDETNVSYLQDSIYNEYADMGIAYNSFGFDWKIEMPILSERDKELPDFKLFNSPFEYTTR